MVEPDRSDETFRKMLTPAGGIVFSIAVSGVLWSGLVAGMHFAGVF